MRSIFPTRAMPRKAVPAATRTAASPTVLPVVLAAGLLVLAGCSEYESPRDRPDADGVQGGGVQGSALDPVDDGVQGGVGDVNTDVGAGTGTNVEGDPGSATDLPADDDPSARPFGPVDVPGDLRGIAGLYDASIDGPLGVDVRYVLITLEGTFTRFDYDLDPYGTGLNCHRDARPLPLVRDRDDDYLLDGRSVRIARETLGIGFGYTDTLDDDRDGDSGDFVYYRYPSLPGLSAIDLNVCL